MVRGTILVRTGRRAEGIRSYDRSIECDASYTPGYLIKAMMIAAEGRRKEAIACCDAALASCIPGPAGDYGRMMAKRQRDERVRGGQG